MKVYEVYGEDLSIQFHDIVVAKDEEQLKEILTKRYGEVFKINSICISTDKVRINELTAGDLLRLLGNEKETINELETIRNMLRKMNEECKKYKPCNDCLYKSKCDEISDEYTPIDILNIIEIIEKLLNDKVIKEE